jgi:DUF218 domain-containing protein
VHVATTLVVFGRGADVDERGRVVGLSPASRARVHAVLHHIAAHAEVFRRCGDGGTWGRVIFSGGWAGAAADLPSPPDDRREASLMADLATATGVMGEPLSGYVDVAVEADSDSTLENVLRIHELGLLADRCFSPSQPLGLVAHREHLARIGYFVRKVLALSSDAVVPVLAPGPDGRSRGLPEPVLHQVTRLAFLGASTADALRRREQLLVRAGRVVTPARRTRPRTAPTPR